LALSIDIKKYVKAKKKAIMETQIYLFHHAKIESSKKNLLKKETKILQDIRTLKLMSSFNYTLKPKYHISKTLI